MNRLLHTTAIALATMGLVAIIYWPVAHGGWYWDDHVCFHDEAWLRYGDGWKQFIFQNFCDWVDYFRPLVVAMLVVEVRTFDVAPGPMHLVSLAMHLTNTLLVGLLAVRLTAKFPTSIKPVFSLAFSMLFYGLHPILIEPVFWIGCQYEQVLTFFILLGLLLNASIRQELARGLAVATCFFLAACSKESAISFPLIVLVLDAMATRSDHMQSSCAATFQSIWKRQGRVYICLLLAGIAYLLLRYWALGFVVHPLGAQSPLSLARWQKSCFTYVMYWRMMVWPMLGLGPIHQVDEQRFATIDPALLAIDVVALIILLGGLYLFARKKLIGYLILAASVALFPVLHIIPIGFNESLYHERYAMTALAIACAFLPCAAVSLMPPVRARFFNFFFYLLSPSLGSLWRS